MNTEPTMTPQQLLAALSSLGKPQQAELLSRMDHSTLYRAREGAPRELQNVLAPYEHRAFARQATAENPWMALPIAAATMVYQPAKALLGQSRSDPSLGQVGQGLYGVGEGAWQAFKNAIGSPAGAGQQQGSEGLLASLSRYRTERPRS